jgi:2-oxoglutarate ferredoxin oxidoreductase subunit beta
MSRAPLPQLTPKELATDQDVRWCPGCGDYSVLAHFKQALSEIGIPRERLALVSGLGCAGRLPYYVDTFGFHTVPGRACTIASGLKVAQPDLSVWVIVGDGDAFSVGTNHLVQALRRNVDIKILMLNNEVFGLTRGQFSPTSRLGTRSRTTPDGSVEPALRPLSMAIAAEATFVARTIDVDADHFVDVISRAAEHRGAAFVEIYQNCNVFNDGVFEFATDHETKSDAIINLEHGQRLVFGRDRKQGIRLSGLTPEVVPMSRGTNLDDLLVHNEQAADANLAWVLSRMAFPELPECFGVFRAIERPTWDDSLGEMMSDASPTLQELLVGDDSWTVS